MPKLVSTRFRCNNPTIRHAPSSSPKFVAVQKLHIVEACGVHVGKVLDNHWQRDEYYQFKLKAIQFLFKNKDNIKMWSTIKSEIKTSKFIIQIKNQQHRKGVISCSFICVMYVCGPRFLSFSIFHQQNLKIIFRTGFIFNSFTPTLGFCILKRVV